MFTYSFHGKQTVIWYSTKTNRPLVPSTRPIKLQVQAESFSEALDKLRDLAESKVTKDQKRDVHITGHINKVDNGKVIDWLKF